MARVSKRDVNGTPLKRGDEVTYLGARIGYWSGLTRADQREIAKRIGLRHVVDGIDAHGYAELTFQDSTNDFHRIWVPGSCLEKTANRPRQRAQRKPLR